MIDISFSGLIWTIGLIIIPVITALLIKVRIVRSLIINIGRMTLQLVLAAYVLTILFDMNIVWLTLVWYGIMLSFAAIHVYRATELRNKTYAFIIGGSFIVTSFPMLLFFTTITMHLQKQFDARYFIVLAGMMIGNSIKSNILGVSYFIENSRLESNQVEYLLSCGATMWEAVHVQLVKALEHAMKPVIANIATMGLVFLPGMMTGQILAGADPLQAIKYQIAIMIAIFITSFMSLALSLFFMYEKKQG